MQGRTVRYCVPLSEPCPTNRALTRPPQVGVPLYSSSGGSGEQSEPHSPNRKVWLVGAWHTSVAPQLRRPELLQLIWFPLPVQLHRSAGGGVGGCGGGVGGVGGFNFSYSVFPPASAIELQVPE